MLPDAPPYMKYDEDVANQLTDFNSRLQHLERLEDPAAGYNITRVWRDATQALAGGVGVWTAISFNQETRDDLGWHDLVNPTRITVDADGIYTFIASIRSNGNNDMAGFIDFRINGGQATAGSFGDGSDGLLGAACFNLSNGDFVEVGYQSLVAGGRVSRAGENQTYMLAAGPL